MDVRKRKSIQLGKNQNVANYVFAAAMFFFCSNFFASFWFTLCKCPSPPYLDISDSDCKLRRLLLLPFFFVSAANANFKLIVALFSS